MNKRLRKKKGLSKITNEELWDLDYTIAKFILPRLIRFKELVSDNKGIHSYPADLKNMEEWIAILDKMINSFEILKNEFIKNNRENYEKYIEGMNLFAKYISDLWD
ncbi:hypothetical protein FDF74_11555 [Clostridium niameyense]|uniref:Uncharacterized protein n=1 Tax=Clostridium niameyense TaxID=1622073 RepID=A0A6M0RDC7_9CLOT|nr:hypothetical protein [Clostridium niameyense]NEZ47817.1 hypothetical protein [Clostridium niameyense]